MSVSIFASSLFADEDQDVLCPAGPTSTILNKQMDNLNMGFTASVIGGYDTNVYLDHYDATSSMFIQESFGADGKYILSDFITLKASYDLTSINYTRESEWNLLNNTINAGLDAKIMDSLSLLTAYIVDFVDFPHDQAEEYTLQAIEAGLRQDITDWLYHRIIYRYSYKHYPKWKTRNSIGVIQLDDREDRRSAFEHQLGLDIADKTFIRADNAIYFNNSNELFLDYYDYTAVKTSATVIQLIMEELYGSVNLGYEYKRYDNRVVSDRVHGDQRDHLLMSGASLFYDITPNLSIGTNFDYRRNLSNEGNRKYKNYIISTGMYAKF